MDIFISASSIRDYISCGKKVEYRLKKSRLEQPNKEMLSGRIIHEALQYHWNDRTEAVKFIQKKCSEDKRLSKDTYTNLSFMLDMFFLNFRGMVHEEDEIEYSFKVKLFDDVFLVGKIDRLSNGNIFDWKSGKVSKNLQNDVQCIVYNEAYKMITGKEPTSIVVASLSEGSITPYVKNEQYSREVFNKVIPRLVKTIRDGDYSKTGMFNGGCFRCTYKSDCIGGANELVRTDFIE